MVSVPPQAPLGLVPPADTAPRLGRHFLIANDPRLDPGVVDALAPEAALRTWLDVERLRLDGGKR
jgi:hypothetical protein